jgi:hypothetical protein
MIYADERYIADSEHYQYKGMKIYLTVGNCERECPYYADAFNA